MPADPARTAQEAQALARMQTLLHRAEASADQHCVSRLSELAASSRQSPQVALLAECALEEVRSRARPAAESAAAWLDLRRRAEACLSAADPALLRIRVQHARHVRRCGRPQDLREAVRLSEAEWMLSDALFGADDYRTAAARAELAVALGARGRHDDLSKSRVMLAEELRDRRDRYGLSHPFTWGAQLDLAETLVRLAGLPGRQPEFAARAERLSRIAAWARSERFGADDPGALGAHLLHARALLLLGQRTSAIGEIKYVMAIAARRRTALRPGCAEYLLASALAADSNPAARRTAQRALRLSAAHYPADSQPVRRALHLVDRLTARP